MPPPKFFRLKPGGEVRLKYAYIIKCDEVVKDAAGKITELRCTADLDSKTGGATAGRKVKGTIHWVSAAHAVDAEVRLYDRLFTVPEPDKDGRDFKTHPEPAQPRSRHRQVRAEPERREAGAALSIRAPRLLRARQGQRARQARLQPHDHAERHLGEGSAEELITMITSPMRKQRNLLFLSVCLLAALVLVAVPFRSREPRYQGHSLSYWLTLYGETLWHEGGDPKAKEAITHIGTNALPFFLEWIRHEPQPSGFRTAAGSFFRKVPNAITPEALVRWACEDEAESKAQDAMHAFALLGPQARTALPKLFKLMNDASATNASLRAALALAYIGKDALPLFLAQIANTNALHRADAVVLINMCDDLTTDAGPTLPVLIQCLIDNDTNVVKEAALVLHEYDLKPGLILPALTNCLGTSTNSLLRSRVFWVLGRIGCQARPAQPFLVAALQDADANVRKQATNALLRIAPEVLTNAPVQ